MLEKEYMCNETTHISKKSDVRKISLSSNWSSKSLVLKNSCSHTCRCSARVGTRMPVDINAPLSFGRLVGRSKDRSCLTKCLVRGRCIGQESSRSADVIKESSRHEVSRLPWYTRRPVASAREPRDWWRDEGIDRCRSEAASHSRYQNHEYVVNNGEDVLWKVVKFE